MEACALLLGSLVDETKELTMVPMSAAACEIALSALRLLCSQSDSLRVDLESRLRDLRRTRKEIDIEGRLNNGKRL